MKPLSDRLQWMFDNDYMDWDIVSDAIQLAKSVESAPVAIMDTRDVLGLCAPAEEDFPALYAIQGQRVALVPLPQQSENLTPPTGGG